MSLTIYQLPHSPYCIPITAALTACDVLFETRDVPNWDRSEIIRLTGGMYYQVPVLVHDEQIVLESGPETQDIPRYIDRIFGDGKLFPPHLEGLQAIVIEYLENDVEDLTFRLVDPFYLDTMEDVVGKTMTIRHKERKFGRNCIDQWRNDAASIRAEADRRLDRFETTLRHSAFLFGDAPVYSDFLLYGIIRNLTWNDWNELDGSQEALQRWSEGIRGYRYN